jgi:hypothetical protein
MSAVLMLALVQGSIPCINYQVQSPAPSLFKSDKFVIVELAPIAPALDWTEMIPSWNVDHSDRAEMTIEARVIYPDHQTKYFSFGTWSGSNLIGSRFSVNGQKDADGTVLTDTLRMVRAGGKVQIRLSGRSLRTGATPKLTRLFLNFSNPALLTEPQAPSPEPSAHSAWGMIIDPPRFAQGDYPGGKALCSPASVAMVLDYWAARLGQKSVGATVPQVQSSVFDSVYGGTGNWAFNASYAGSRPGLLGYAARLSTIEDLESWIVRGVPVVCSVSWYLLHGEALQSDEEGHLVVLVGFTPTGDPVFNDPGKRGEVRKIYKREDFLKAWAYSKHAVYIVTPPKFLQESDLLLIK